MEGYFDAVAVAGVAMVTIIVFAVIWQVFNTAQIKISADKETELMAQYRQAIADATAAQQVSANRLAELSEGVRDLRERVGSVETLLREVE
ncbi:MAG: hypothetical protein IT335_02370 [Thermomicrobiales bacterium]|jgi:hypothetical protein|nr:hypothetical protein [Thermomicrobiales bacterium]